MNAPPPRITAYRFGRIEIDGRSHESDLLLFRGRIFDISHREQGHTLMLADLAPAPIEDVTHIVVGSGADGLMTVAEAVTEFCDSRNIVLEVMRTPDAVKRYNTCRHEAGLLGVFHVTC